MTAKIKLNAASGGGSVSITAPSSTTGNANIELKLPIADGSSEQVIKTDGSGNLSFGQAVTAKNLVINGAMEVAQHGTSSTDSGVHTVDRFQYFGAGTDEAPTQSQADVAAGTTPYSLGFRKCFKITNGNQTSGAGAADYVWFRYVVEDQDIATSGWNYTSASSFITLSFWVKSSVSQVFNGVIRSLNGTSQMYPISLGSLTADTWTKITKTIPGNSNITFNNNNTAGLAINIFPFFGTNYTDNAATENAWAVNNGSARAKDSVTTWYTTNDATFEVTGFQLEVGSSASAFAHETFAETLAKCQRYYFVLANQTDSNLRPVCNLGQYNASAAYGVIHFPVQMRTPPSLDATSASTSYIGYGGATGEHISGFTLTQVGDLTAELNCALARTQGDTVFVRTNAVGVKVAFKAEL